MAENGGHSEVFEQLVDVIRGMSPKSQEALLEKLGGPRNGNKRKFPRKPFKSMVYLATESRVFRGFMKNISAGGLFVETGQSLVVGEQLVVSFTTPKKKEPVKKNGIVVRQTEEGIGIRFSQ